MLEAKSSSDSSDSKDLLAKSIDFLARLPFDYKTLKECKLGKVVKKLATDDGVDQGKLSSENNEFNGCKIWHDSSSHCLCTDQMSS